MDLFVFDLNFNRLGVIDDFINLDINSNYDSLSMLSLTVEGSKEYIDLLQTDHILVKANDLTKGYIIQTKEFIDENSSELRIIAHSLNVILNDRLVLGQQEFTGTIEDVMKSFVLVNAVSPVNPNRIIPNLQISANHGIAINTTEGTKNKPLCDYLYDLCKKHDVSFDILLDHTNKKFIFDVWQGMDRSTQQTMNAHVIFSKSFDNVLQQHYTESVSDMKSTAVVLGEENQTIVAVYDELSGFDRKEMLVESNVTSTYKDENGADIVLTPLEYETLLIEEGKKALSEYRDIKTFESTVDPQSNFVYGLDYFMGDKVSIRNDDLGIIMHTRIISSRETISREGEFLQINFGTNIPTFLDKVKRAVK